MVQIGGFLEFITTPIMEFLGIGSISVLLLLVIIIILIIKE